MAVRMPRVSVDRRYRWNGASAGSVVILGHFALFVLMRWFFFPLRNRKSEVDDEKALFRDCRSIHGYSHCS
jgi:hypothetical protein